MKEITIGYADKNDAESIYDLLACEGCRHSLEAIEEGIGNYILLRVDALAVAVLEENKSQSGGVFAVHPGFPQKSVIESVRGLLSAARQRENIKV